MPKVPARKEHRAMTRLETLRRRVTALYPRLLRKPAAARELAETFEELGTSLEELQVAEEELRQQNEELVSTRRALEGERERYVDLFEAAPDGYLVTNPEGMIRDANRAAAAQLRVPRTRLVGKPLANFIVLKDRRAFRSEVSRLRQVDRIADWETRLQPRDGEPFVASLSVTTERDRTGAPVALRWLVRDISVRTEHAEQIRSLNEELEQRVVLRTAQLEKAIDSEHVARMEAEEAQRRLVFLAEVSEEMSRSFDEEAMLRLVSHLIVPALAEICLFDIVGDDGAVKRLAWAHTGPATDTVQRFVPSGEFAAQPVASVLKSGKPLFVPEVTDGWMHTAAANPDYRAFVKAMSVCSWLTVPMTIHGKVLGALTMCRALPSPPFTRDDVALAEEIARRAALAFDNARLYQRERNIAETLQRSLLPDRLPRIAGAAVGARYLPAKQERIGGDWYDVLELPNGTIGIAVGDVSGKGVQAAVMMGKLRSGLRAYALEGHSPSAVLDRLDRLLRDFDSSQMATVLYMTVDPATWTVHFSSAGHVPPLLRTPRKMASYLGDGRYVPLGVSDRPVYREAVHVVEPGSTLLLYTDGLIERQGGPLEDGLRRLQEAAAEGPEDPNALCDHVVTSLLPGGSVADDVALIALHVVLRLERPLEMNFSAEPDELRNMRSTLTRWMTEVNASSDEAYDVVVAAGEAVTNAIQHAYGPGPASISVRAALEDSGVVVTVRDWGRWHEHTSEGYGLRLIRGLMDSVEIDIRGDGEGTAISMRRRLERSRAS